MTDRSDLRFIETGFPCHQVGAETQRERDTGKAPPTHRLHVWWARRPLTPSRAAILGSLLPADTDPDWFLCQLGIKKKVVEINGQEWVLEGNLLEKIDLDSQGNEIFPFYINLLNDIEKENKKRVEIRKIIDDLVKRDKDLVSNPVVIQFKLISRPIDYQGVDIHSSFPVKTISGDPSWFKSLLDIAQEKDIRVPNLYGYERAFHNQPDQLFHKQVVLDPTAGGGSIPFESLRLGCRTISNELNPVASVILQATLDFPLRFGNSLIENIEKYGKILLTMLGNNLHEVFPTIQPLQGAELKELKEFLKKYPEYADIYSNEHTTTFLYCRQVICPHCHGEVPLLNTSWLSKEAGKQWGVSIITDGKERNGSVQFKIYRVSKGKGPNGEDPNFATVNQGVGYCVHCKQAIDAKEIKCQARGESEHGKWKDRLYSVVAIRFQPKLDKQGKPIRYKSGEKAGEIKTEKVRFFRTPNETDSAALRLAEKRLQENWDRWDKAGLIPTESFPEGNDMRPVIYGMDRWCDLFTPRQLFGHLTLIDELNKLKPQILSELGEEKGKAVVTYLQFAIDKGLDYNSKQTRWHYSRGVMINTFGRHDFSLKWTFGEMIFSGPNSGANWGLSQILDAYKGIAELCLSSNKEDPSVQVINGTAAHMPVIANNSVDLICMDPPYYNNVQYAELSDYFYVWQKRTLSDLYPDFFTRRLTNKQDEAVANPARDGSVLKAKKAYEKLMGDIFRECQRVLKDDGIMTLMFTHKTQEAWETLTQALIQNGWVITSSFPVESETQQGIHTKGNASATSSIFISCRKKLHNKITPSVWSDFGGSGVQNQIVEGVRAGLQGFQSLKLGPVDEMVASYGRALRVLSENWPVIDGDEMVGPSKAMNEASRVVAENQIERITQGRLHVADLSPESAMSLTLYGIYGLGEIPYDDVLNLSRSLNISLTSYTGGYQVNGSRFIGINNDSISGRRSSGADANEMGYYAPLIKKGSKLRLAKPSERNSRRLANPQTEWDLLQGSIMAYREGDIVLATDYLHRHAREKIDLVIDLIYVWASEMSDENLRKEARALLFGLK